MEVDGFQVYFPEWWGWPQKIPKLQDFFSSFILAPENIVRWQKGIIQDIYKAYRVTLFTF